MKYKARLIYKSEYTCFETSLPVYFYGMSNSKMIVLFATNKNDFHEANAFKWILANHLDFAYDFNSDTILTEGFEEVGIDEFKELADNLEQRVKTLATFGNFSSRTEAQQYLNINAYNMLISQNEPQVEISNY